MCFIDTAFVRISIRVLSGLLNSPRPSYAGNESRDETTVGNYKAMKLSPLEALRNVQNQFPTSIYIVGLAIAADIVTIFSGFNEVSKYSTLAILVLILVLVAFGALAEYGNSFAKILAKFLAWTFVLLAAAATLLLMTSYFFFWPRPIDYLNHILIPDRSAAEVIGYVRLASENGDYIGQGREYVFSTENGLFHVKGEQNFISVLFEGDDHWSFDFAAPRGRELEIGTYSSAQRTAFRNPVKPGIDISGAGRGCNKISGSFVIQDIGFSKSVGLEKFVAEFEQHCEEGIPALKGEINIATK